jgi:two-component system chemotaxis response regulator CheB
VATGIYIDLVVLAGSIGAPTVVGDLLAALPRTFPAPILLVQHMQQDFVPRFAARLAEVSALEVVLGREGGRVSSGTVVVAPGDQHMELVLQGTERALRLHRGPKEHSCRPAADVLFRSAARLVGSRVLGVVLTGMGQDGLEGARAIRAAKGLVVVQDAATSVVWDMPGNIVRAGLANAVLPADQFAAELMVRTGGVWGGSQK